MQSLIEFKNIAKSFPGVQALEDVSISVEKNSIHALVGEHRAGKSTLVKLLSGSVVKDTGEIMYRGKKIDYFTPQSAMKSGIGMVYQNTHIIPSLNAIEYIFTGHLIKTWFGNLNYTVMRKKTTELFHRLRLNIDLNVPLDLLPEADDT